MMDYSTVPDLLDAKQRKVFKETTLPALVEKYKADHPEQSWEQSFVAVRDAHITFLETKFPAEGIKREFDGYISEQTIPEGSVFRNCYRRNCTTPGLSGYRKHTFKKGEETLVEWYHHSSPVPYELKDFNTRLTLATQNLQQLPGEIIAEVRLLSPLKGLKAWFARKYFTKLNDYDQLLETAMAAELAENKEILLFNFGVNTGRHYADELQTFLNVRAMSKLLAKAFRELNYPVVPTPDEKLLTQADLNPPNKNPLTEMEAKELFLSRLRNKNKAHILALLTQLTTNGKERFSTDQQKRIYQHTRDIINLLLNNRWEDPKKNYKIQAKLVKLNYLLGHTVATGCNDAKDRDSRLAITIEANEIFARKALEDKRTRQEIEKIVYQQSTPVEAAKKISMPDFAEGLDIGGKSDGNDHLGNSRKIAGIFKHVYTEKQRRAYERLDNPTLWDRFKTRIKPFTDPISKFLVGFTVVFTMAFGSMAGADSLNGNPGASSGRDNTSPILTIVDTMPGKKEETPASSGSEAQSSAADDNDDSYETPSSPSQPPVSTQFPSSQVMEENDSADENTLIAWQAKKVREQAQTLASGSPAVAEKLGSRNFYRHKKTGSTSATIVTVSSLPEQDSDHTSGRKQMHA